ncbi:MAG TPA: hypothetical protein VGF40_06035 [Thermoanaerobaculia bacterium]
MRSIVVALTLALAAACSTAPRAVHAPTEISWARAEELVLAGQVVELESRDGRLVRVHLADGRHLVATEPSEGEALRLVERCGAKCKDVKVRP